MAKQPESHHEIMVQLSAEQISALAKLPPERIKLLGEAADNMWAASRVGRLVLRWLVAIGVVLGVVTALQSLGMLNIFPHRPGGQ